MHRMSTVLAWLPVLICFLFFCAYTTLGIVRHNHFESYGFDLGISDQIVWEYSTFQAPITTVRYYPFTSILTDHLEFVYAPLSSFYWLWSDARMLIVLQSSFICFSALPIYFLARDKKLTPFVSYAVLISYLAFYGIQNALWFDVHSAVFATSFLAWFIYFLDKKQFVLSTLFFLLAILSKENIAFLTFFISLTFFIQRRKKQDLFFLISSLLYLFIVFFLYFPHFTAMGYGYQKNTGLFSDIQLAHLVNTEAKRQVFLVSLGWFGMIPLLSPLTLLAACGDLFSYFVIANNLKEADGLFMHYRITLAPLLTWATISAIASFARLNRWYVGCYLLLMVILFQYLLHLPLSYLTKSWFWKEPSAVSNIRSILSSLPSDASVVSQNNITPHISHRKEIFTLWPRVKEFKKNSPCGKQACNWFHWEGHPRYLIVDTSNNWDIRHLLADRSAYVDGLRNLEKNGYIAKNKQKGSTLLYIIIKKP